MNIYYLIKNHSTFSALIKFFKKTVFKHKKNCTNAFLKTSAITTFAKTHIPITGCCTYSTTVLLYTPKPHLLKRIKKNWIFLPKRFMMSSSGGGGAGKGKMPVTPNQNPSKSPKECPVSDSSKLDPTHPDFLKKPEYLDASQWISTEPKKSYQTPFTTQQMSGEIELLKDKAPQPSDIPTFEDISKSDLVPKESIKTALLEGELKAIRLKMDARDSNGMPIPKHEMEHIAIVKKNTQTGLYETTGILTSSKNNKVTGQPNIKIDDVNFKNEPKKQFYADTQFARIYFPEQQTEVFDVDPAADAYIQDPIRKQIINDHIKQTTQTQRHQLARYHKEDSVLFAEDGIPIKEEDSVQRGPWVKSTTPSTQIDHDSSLDVD